MCHGQMGWLAGLVLMGYLHRAACHRCSALPMVPFEKGGRLNGEMQHHISAFAWFVTSDLFCLFCARDTGTRATLGG